MAKANTEPKQKVDITWLQCQLPRQEWNTLNERRLKLNLKWTDIVLPGTKQYLDYLEANPAQQPKPAAVKNKAATTSTEKTNKAEKAAPKKPARQTPAKPKSKKAEEKAQAEVKPEGSKLVDTNLGYVEVKQ